MGISFYPKNKDIEKMMDRLIHYPVVKVDPRISQTFSKYAKIRYINQGKDKKIYIKKGIIGLSPKVKIKRNGNGFDIDIF